MCCVYSHSFTSITSRHLALVISCSQYTGEAAPYFPIIIDFALSVHFTYHTTSNGREDGDLSSDTKIWRETFNAKTRENVNVDTL